MIECVDRQTCFDRSAFLASSVLGRQQRMIRDIDEQIAEEIAEAANWWTLKDSPDLVVVNPAVYEAEQLRRWTAEEVEGLRAYYSRGDDDDSYDASPAGLTLSEPIAWTRLMLRCRRRSVFPGRLARRIGNCSRALDLECLLFIPLVRAPWCETTNTYAPLRRALAPLAKLLPHEAFDGAIVADRAGLDVVIRAVYWLYASDPGAPEIFFGAPSHGLVMSICKYGDVHIEAYDQPTADSFLRVALHAGFEEVEECENQWPPTAAVQRRRLSEWEEEFGGASEQEEESGGGGLAFSQAIRGRRMEVGEIITFTEMVRLGRG